MSAVDKPARTPFYGLPLIGRNTPEVESIRSYLKRLAAAHSLSPTTLLKLISPSIDARRLAGFRFHGVGRVPMQHAELVESATGVSVKAATMVGFSALLPIMHLIGKEERHCLLCTREKNTHGRLIWELAVVNACPDHGVLLQPTRTCGAPITEHLAVRDRPHLQGVCRSCGSIGYKCISQHAQAANQDEIWIAREASHLVALSDEEVARFSVEQLRTGIADTVAHVFQGMPVAAARRANLAKASVLTWMQGEARPSLGALFQFALAAEASICELFRGRFAPMPRMSSLDIKDLGRTYVRRNWETIRQVVVAASRTEDPPSLSAISKQLSIDKRALRTYLPKEIAALIQAAASVRQQRLRMRQEEELRLYQDAARELAREGKSVYKKNLEAKAGLRSFHRSGSARQKSLLSVIHQYSDRDPERSSDSPDESQLRT